eukprot:GHVS01013530.1.p1 GENE.GHVS01013530.1~~GHVS01013530.1.p1  ORF type:complete len:1478 (+),score=283.06 GHVS01013530.1:2-4435(+)
MYERIGGGTGSEEVVCQDGKFNDPKLKCSIKRVKVLYSNITLKNAADMGPDTVPSIYTALVSSLSIRSPEELRLLSIGAESSIGEDDVPTVCEDNDAIAQGTGVSCEVLKQQFGCSILLQTLAQQNGKELPDHVATDTTVEDACPLTCGVCTARRRRLAASSDLHIAFAILSPRSDTDSIELRFTEDLPTHFLEQLGVQFITRNVRLPGTNGGTSIPAAEALRSRNIAVEIEKPTERHVVKDIWDEGYHRGSGGKQAAKNIFSSGGLVVPTQESVVYVQPGVALPTTPASTLGPTVWMTFDGAVGAEPVQVAVAPIVANVVGQCESLFSSKDPGSCCGMRMEFDQLLESPCGQLLYVQPTTDKVHQFCEGTCAVQFKTVIDKYDSRGGGACELVQFARRIVDSWCSQDQQESYCFSSIDTSHASVDLPQLVTEPSSELDVLCSVESCYRHHLRYFDALTQLQVGWDIADKPEFNIGRLGEGGGGGGGQLARRRRLNATAARGMLSRHLSAAARAAENAGRGVRRSLAVAAEVMGLAGQDNFVLDSFLEGTGGGHASEGGSPPLRRLLNMHTMSGPLGDSSEELLNVVCTKVDGDYCQQTLLLLTEESPVKNPTLVVQPCASRCFVPVTGQLGGIVESYGERSRDPYYRALGAIMRGYGRYYCTQNEQGKLCGEFLFNKIKKVKVEPFLPPGLSAPLPQCGCQQSFVQDGQCDSECFTEGCGWDGEDCLVRRMFPEVFTALSTIVDSQCMFYTTNFECTSKCRAQYETAKSVQGQGCCLSAALEVMGSMLKVQAEHPLVVPQNSWQPDRSVSYLEQMCGASFDRTCSGGRPRTVVTVEVEVDNLQVDKMSREVKEQIQQELRHSVAQYLRIIDGDVVRSVERPLLQGLNVRMEIDAGQQSERVKAQLTNAITVDRLTLLLSRRLGALPLRKYRSATNRPILVHINEHAVRTHKSVSWPLSLLEQDPAPPVPYVGTWGVSSIPTPLRLQSCELKDIMELGPGYLVDRGSTAEGVTVPVHGTSKRARCSPGFESVQGPNPDELVCDNGRWILAGHLDCRKSCTTDPRASYRVADGYRLRGDGLRHGSYRTIECAKGFGAVGPQVVESSGNTIYCRNGDWTEPELVCKATCPTFAGLDQAYNVVGLGTEHGASRMVSCNPHYHATPGPPSGPTQVVVVCEDGGWTKLTMQCIPAKAPPAETSKSAFDMILTQIFSDKGKTIVIITLVMVLVMAVAIFLAWRFYFRGRAKQHLADREEKVERLKRQKGGGGVGGNRENSESPGGGGSSPGERATYAETPSTVYIQNPASRQESIPPAGEEGLSNEFISEEALVQGGVGVGGGGGGMDRIMYDHPNARHQQSHYFVHPQRPMTQEQLESFRAPMMLSEQPFGPGEGEDFMGEEMDEEFEEEEEGSHQLPPAAFMEDRRQHHQLMPFKEDARQQQLKLSGNYRTAEDDLEHCASPYSVLQHQQQFRSLPHGGGI